MAFLDDTLKKIVDVLSSKELQDFATGKSSPTIKTDNKVTVAKETLTTAGGWILGGFIASAAMISTAIFFAVRSGVKYYLKNTRSSYNP